MSMVKRLPTMAAVPPLALMSMGCSSESMPGPKTEQAIGTGAIAIGAVVTPFQPEVGIPLVVGGAAVAVHGASREDAGGSK